VQGTVDPLEQLPLGVVRILRRLFESQHRRDARVGAVVDLAPLPLCFRGDCGRNAFPQLRPAHRDPAEDPESPWGPDTGVPSILAFPDDPTRYLVLERTWVVGAGFKVRIFDATTRGATEVQDVDSLAEKKVVPMRKTLVADFHDLPLSTVDNTEGMTWGPTLPTGERTLLLISDDNFAAEEVTQVVR
jgi:phytase-like protein